MYENSDMIPVLQLDDLNSLEEAQDYMGRHGYRTSITSFEDLPESEYLDWMEPDDGGYLLWIEASEYEAAMDLLGSFFGYTEDVEDEEIEFYPEDEF